MSRSRNELLFVCLAAAALAVPGCHSEKLALSVGPEFAGAVDLSQIRLAAVQDDGRVKTLDSLAREKLAYVNTAGDVRATDPVLLYLDLMLAPERYYTRNIIRIKKPFFRAKLVQTIKGSVPAEQRQGLIAPAELDRIQNDGLVSPAFLDHPSVSSALAVLERDLMRTGKEVNALNAARAYSDGRTLESLLRMVPVPGAKAVDPWLTLGEAAVGDVPHRARASRMGVMTAAMDDDASSAPAMAGHLNPALRGVIATSWDALAQSWKTQDARAASTALNQLAGTLATVSPGLYPSLARRAWEHWYYAWDKLTFAWLIYFFALPFLLMATVYNFRWARVTGLALFGFGLGVHTFSIALRWWLAGRIPNANMFEAVTASAWFGGVVALGLELFLRRWPVKNLPALAASSYAMLALMTGKFLPVLLPGAFSSDISTVMPVLDRTVWLYIHTNMVIASYALIFFGAVTAAMYLALRGAVRVVPGGALQRVWLGSSGEGAVKGGAATIIMGRGMQQGSAPETGLARSLDGATMIFLELAFITLWVGTILGAVWAYFSWGRPWGWDPKEVFALNTWIVFLILVHVRLKVKDKAFWTAVLAVIGCMVMLYNWIAVNFVIVGLHSYA